MTDAVVVAKGLPVLQNVHMPRVAFDPQNTEHREILKHFMEHGKWSSSYRFSQEYPYLNVPMTCIMKLAKFHLDLN